MNIATLIVIAVLFLGALAFNYLMIVKRDKAEKERFREMVLAVKSKDAQEYSLVLPPDEKEEMPIQEDIDLIPLEEMDPEELLKIKK
jgi:hypothetical protein